MQAFKENTDSVHQIDPDSKGAIASRFNELVNSLENGEDQEVQDQVKSFHHSDLADAIGLLQVI